jgi:predicted PurR-regulated permease PerM
MAEPEARADPQRVTAGSDLADAPAREAGDGLHIRLPEWFQTVGRGAWLAVGIALAVVIAVLFAGLISDLLIPLIFATILAAIFVPLVDRLERMGVPRSLAASLVVVIALIVVVGVIWMVIVAVIGAGADIVDQVTAGINEAGSLVDASQAGAERTTEVLANVVKVLVEGVLRGLGSVTVLVVGMVTGVFILLYLMKDWDLVSGWTSGKTARFFGLPNGVGEQILEETTISFRSYAAGLTIVGAMNAAVVGLGALLLDVPSAGAIAIVTFVTSYIPFFGAFFAGAFAVVIALGAKGLSIALGILAITLLANNTLQNLLEPIAFGKTLKMHPLVVLLVTTGGTLLFGVLGATLAAPVTAVVLRTITLLRNSRPGFEQSEI